MTLGSPLVMLGLGIIALISGLWLLLRRAANEPARYRNRIAGAMAAALGAALLIFAIGLGALSPAPDTDTAITQGDIS